MIHANFYTNSDDEFIGFIVRGHAGVGRYGEDILCAGVSSAVMLTANTITEFLGVKAIAKVRGDAVGLKLVGYSEIGSRVIESLYEHLIMVNDDYQRILITKKRILERIYDND